jgi:ADP-ribosylglycohydrolase
MPDARSRVLGCLLGGAVGDALGAPLEFLPLEEIERRHGPAGPAALGEAYGRRGAITDDTQMTLFTAEGLIRAFNRGAAGGALDVPGVVHGAYLRWLATQGTSPAGGVAEGLCDGWLVGVRELWARRAAGATCLSALASGRMGTLAAPINDSKGCGGVMRAAPAGFITWGDAFMAGCEVAAITHGHPSGYLAAGVLAELIRALAAGAPLAEAVGGARQRLRRWKDHEECLAALDAAVARAAAGRATALEVTLLGAGWVGEEALAIGVLAALVARDFEHGVRLAVTHSGDSDSTGSIAGQILGTLLGVEAIPRRWLDALELRDVIAVVAEDLAAAFDPGREPRGAPYDPERYPGH